MNCLLASFSFLHWISFTLAWNVSFQVSVLANCQRHTTNSHAARADCRAAVGEQRSDSGLAFVLQQLRGSFSANPKRKNEVILRRKAAVGVFGA